MKYSEYIATLGPVVFRWVIIGKGYKKRHGRERAKFFKTGKHGMKRPK